MKSLIVLAIKSLITNKLLFQVGVAILDVAVDRYVKSTKDDWDNNLWKHARGYILEIEKRL